MQKGALTAAPGPSDPAVPWPQLRKAAPSRPPPDEGGGGGCCQARIRPSTVLVKGIRGVLLSSNVCFTEPKGGGGGAGGLAATGLPSTGSLRCCCVSIAAALA